MNQCVSAFTSESHSSADHFLPIALDTIRAEVDCDFDLYHRFARTAMKLYRHRNLPLKQADLNRLLESGVKTLFIRFADRGLYSEYLQRMLLANEQLTLTDRYQLLTHATRSLFENAFRGGNVDDVVLVASQLGRQLTDILAARETLLRDLFVLMLHDYYTFTHVTNVCTYCLAIAGKLGISDRQELEAIAAGALLHDFGKQRIAAAILNKPSNLEDSERDIVRRHPGWGFEALCRQPQMTWSQLMMVYQHHERLDGRGYPVGLVEVEIHDWAKMCAVADVFDALTSDRPHRKAVSADDALEFLNQRAVRSFDKEMVQCLNSAMRSK
jgi:HD-GYP domain-containing protein (c-di-GMP phosphodiesterase class II)